MRQADYTAKTTALAAKARELDAIYGQAQEALEVMAYLNANPEQALAELSQMYLGQANGQTPGQQTQQTQQGQQGQQVPAEVVQLIENYLGPIRQENEQLKGQLYGYMANTQLEREWSGLAARDPRVASDPAFRARLSEVAARRGLPLEEAYKLDTWDEVRTQADSARADAQARTLRNFIPSIGGSARPGNGGQQPPVDSQQLFERSFVESLKEMGYID